MPEDNGENGEAEAQAQAAEDTPILFPNLPPEEQDMELEPVVMGPPAYGSPDPATALNTLLPLTDDPHATVEGPEQEAANEAAAAGGEAAGDGEEAGATNYSEMSKDDLQAEADKRGLEVEGSGANGNVVKDDLVDALEADDEANDES